MVARIGVRQPQSLPGPQGMGCVDLGGGDSRAPQAAAPWAPRFAGRGRIGLRRRVTHQFHGAHGRIGRVGLRPGLLQVVVGHLAGVEFPEAARQRLAVTVRQPVQPLDGGVQAADQGLGDRAGMVLQGAAQQGVEQFGHQAFAELDKRRFGGMWPGVLEGSAHHVEGVAEIGGGEEGIAGSHGVIS